MKRILWAMTAAALLAFGACEATDNNTDATTTDQTTTDQTTTDQTTTDQTTTDQTTTDQTTTDQTPACTASASNVYDGCLKFRDALCTKLVACNSFADKVECGNWFDSEDAFGGCDPDFTDPVASAAKFEECICDIPDQTCESIAAGVLTALPACGEWVPAP